MNEKESSRIKQNAVFSFGRIDSDKQLEIEPDVNLSNVWIQIIWIMRSRKFFTWQS